MAGEFEVIGNQYIDWSSVIGDVASFFGDSPTHGDRTQRDAAETGIRFSPAQIDQSPITDY